MTTPPDEIRPDEIPPTPVETPAWLGPAITWFGLIVAVWGAVLLAMVGAFLTPLRVGGVLVPVAVILVIVGNVLLIRYTYDATGHVWLSLVPGLVWLVITLLLSNRTTEGDLVLASNNWVATVYLFAGSLAVGFAFYRLLNPRRPRA